MKKIFILFLAIALGQSGCDDAKANLTSRYENLKEMHDTLQVRHQEFRQSHAEMRRQHREFSLQVQGMEVQDSTILGNLARHEVILDRHDAYLSSHEEFMTEHGKFAALFAQLSDVEREAKIQEMKEDHVMIASDQESMEEEHNNMMDVFEAMRQMLQNTTPSDGGEEQ